MVQSTVTRYGIHTAHNLSHVQVRAMSLAAHRIQRLLERYPDRCPVVLQQHRNGKPVPLERDKFIVPRDMTFGTFASTCIRRHVGMPAEAALFYFCGNRLIPLTRTLQQVYDEHVSPDGALYITLAQENTFG